MSDTHFCYSGSGIFRNTSQCKMNCRSPRNAVRVSAFASVNCSLLAGDAAGRQALKMKLCTSAELQKAGVQLHSSSSAGMWRVMLASPGSNVVSYQLGVKLSPLFPRHWAAKGRARTQRSDLGKQQNRCGFETCLENSGKATKSKTLLIYIPALLKTGKNNGFGVQGVVL